MEYNNSWYRRVEYMCIFLAVILQLVSVAAPGWQIVVHGNTEKYVAVFYEVNCKSLGACEIRSKHNIYQDNVSKSKFIGKEYRLRIDTEYHSIITQQVYMITILVITLIVMFMQRYKLKRKDVKLPRLTAGTVLPLATAGGLMISIIVDECLWIDYMLDLMDGDPRDNRYIGFPYCLATYIAAFLVMLIANCLYVKEICKSLQKAPAPPPKKVFEDEYVPPIAQISKGVDSFTSNGIDSNECDVRL